MLDLMLQRHAALLKPSIALRQACKWRHEVPQAAACIAHVVLHLTLLPARSRVAEISLEHEVTDQRGKACVDVALLATAYPVYGGAHVLLQRYSSFQRAASATSWASR